MAEGYDEGRFTEKIPQQFLCIICSNVIKEPVACRRNEHCFCKPCILRHLNNAERCPVCNDELTAETLSTAPRIYESFLSGLNIHCDYYERGCREPVPLEFLIKHVESCGYAAICCRNEGCFVQVNKRDLSHHQYELCEFRKVQCHDCSELRKEVDSMKTQLVAVNEKLDMSERNFTEIKQCLAALQEQTTHVVREMAEEMSLRYEQGEKERKDALHGINVAINEMKTEISRRNQEDVANENKERNTRKQENVIVAGGAADCSTEMLDCSNMTWSPLQPMKQSRYYASSVISENEMLVTGGGAETGPTNVIEKLKMNTPDITSEKWSKFPATIPEKLYGHTAEVYNGRLLVIGGCDDNNELSKNISEVLLHPPYTTKLLTQMPQARSHHGSQVCGDKIVIFGGTTALSSDESLDDVLIYDIKENRFENRAPLPYPVLEMSAVKWNENIAILGGEDRDEEVFIYNVKDGKSYMLPDMLYKRRGSAAVVVENKILVMGGKDDKRNKLNSVEMFSFLSYSWEELPPMNKARFRPTAVSY